MATAISQYLRRVASQHSAPSPHPYCSRLPASAYTHPPFGFIKYMLRLQDGRTSTHTTHLLNVAHQMFLTVDARSTGSEFGQDRSSEMKDPLMPVCGSALVVSGEYAYGMITHVSAVWMLITIHAGVGPAPV